MSSACAEVGATGIGPAQLVAAEEQRAAHPRAPVQDIVAVPSDVVLTWRNFCLPAGRTITSIGSRATADPHTASLEVAGRHPCGLGGCHANDHLPPATAADASRAVMLTASPSAVKSSTGSAQPGRPNECHAGVDSRSYWNGHRRRAAGPCRPLGQLNCCCYCCACAGWCGPLIPPKKSPTTSSPTTLSTMPS